MIKQYCVDVEEQDAAGNKRYFIRTIAAENETDAWLSAQVAYEYFDGDGSSCVVLKVYLND